MKVRIITVGKAASLPVREVMNEYEKRLTRWTEVTWINIPPKRTPSDDSESILRQIKKDDCVILLDENGVQYDNQQIAEYLGRWMESGKRLVFIIGGAYGVDDTLKKRADYVWSFSMLVFPHQIMKILLIEQLYRAFDYRQGGKYHHR